MDSIEYPDWWDRDTVHSWGGVSVDLTGKETQKVGWGAGIRTKPAQRKSRWRIVKSGKGVRFVPLAARVANSDAAEQAEIAMGTHKYEVVITKDRGIIRVYGTDQDFCVSALEHQAERVVQGLREEDPNSEYDWEQI